jgi:hypothetical protein
MTTLDDLSRAIEELNNASKWEQELVTISKHAFYVWLSSHGLGFLIPAVDWFIENWGWPWLRRKIQELL